MQDMKQDSAHLHALYHAEQVRQQIWNRTRLEVGKPAWEHVHVLAKKDAKLRASFHASFRARTEDANRAHEEDVRRVSMVVAETSQWASEAHDADVAEQRKVSALLREAASNMSSLVWNPPRQSVADTELWDSMHSCRGAAGEMADSLNELFKSTSDAIQKYTSRKVELQTRIKNL